MTKYILISGKKQSGKDFFAKQLRKRLEANGLTTEKAAFADPIKRFVNDVFGIPIEDMESEEGKQKSTYLKWDDIENCGDYVRPEKYQDYITIRELLQIIGTDVCRKSFYGLIWAEAPFRRKYIRRRAVPDSGRWSSCGEDWLEDFANIPTDVILIPDCRFPNELQAGLNNDAVIVRITSPSWGDIADDNHASETALDDYEWDADVKFMNNRVGTEHIDRYIDDVILPKLGINKVGH